MWHAGVRQGTDRKSVGKQYTWQLRRLASEDPRTHGPTLVPGGLLPIKLRMNGGASIKVSTVNLLEWSGLSAEGAKHYQRLEKLKSELAHMAARGYVGGWRVKTPQSDPLDEVIEIEPPDWLAERLDGIAGDVRPAENAAPAPTAMSAQRLRRLRRSAGVSLRAFAGQLGVSIGLLSEIENERRPVSADLAARVHDWEGRR